MTIFLGFPENSCTPACEKSFLNDRLGEEVLGILKTAQRTLY